MNASIRERHRYSFLDGMRGIAALFVVMRHTEGFWGVSFFRSYLAVDLFFVLSGFVIASAYDEKIRTGVMSLSGFMKVRLIRLYPVYFISILLSAAVLVVVNDFDPQKLQGAAGVMLLTMLFVPSRLVGATSLYSLNVVYWSLFYELLANFAYAVVRPLLTDRVLYASVILLGLIVSLGAWLNGSIDMGVAWSLKSIAAGLVRATFGVFLGLLLHRHRASIVGRLTKYISPWLALLLMTLSLASPGAGRFNVAVDLLVVGVLFPICVLAASQGATRRLDGLLCTLGAASYPIYVLHVPIGRLLHKSFAGLEDYAPASGIALATVLVLLSVWIEKYYDIPVRRWLTGLTSRRSR
jgi:peptidoglycan/LPS O-acetylase OafA/YrhL